MSKPSFSLKDHVLVGLGVGLATPLFLGAVAWYLMNHTAFFKKADLLLIGCVAVNVLWVNYFSKQSKESATKGVVSATFLWAFVFFFYKMAQEA